jgi:hypothetical protein
MSKRARFLQTCALATAGVVVGSGALAPAASAAVTNATPDVRGTWALQQVSSAAQLDALTPSIDRALDTPGVRGFSMRVPWNAIDNGVGADLALLDKGRRLAVEHGVDFSVRFMAGRHTPRRVIDAGPSYVLATGEKTPAPFSRDGKPNTAFEREYDAIVAKLAAWSRGNGVRLLHLPWYGQDWAELNNGRQVRAAVGYSYASWLAAHKRLIDIGLKYDGNGLAVEFPMSGYGPLVDAARALTGHIVSRVGKDNPYVYVQANGWGPSGDWGAPDATTETQMDAAVWPQGVRRGEQAIQPDDYDWTGLFATLRANKAAYAEVYVPSFAAARKGLLAAEIAGFAPKATADSAENDATAPTAPAEFWAKGRATTALRVAWTPSRDNVGVHHYTVRRGATVLARILPGQALEHVDRGLRPKTTYTYSVTAVDAKGNVSTPKALRTTTR